MFREHLFWILLTNAGLNDERYIAGKMPATIPSNKANSNRQPSITGIIYKYKLLLSNDIYNRQ